MATVQWVLDTPPWCEGDLLPPGLTIVKWPDLHSGDVGAPFTTPQFPSKGVVEVGGVYGTGGTLRMEASDVVAPGSPRYALITGAAAAMSFTAASGNPATDEVRAMPYQIRPNCSVGDVTTDLTVRLIVETPARV